MKSIIGVLVFLALTVYVKGAFIQFGGDVHNGEHISEANITRIMRGTVAGLITELEGMTHVPKEILAQRLVKVLMYITDDETIKTFDEFRGNLTEFNRNMSPSNSTRFVDGETVVIGRSIFGFGHLAVTTFALHRKASKMCLINELAPVVFNIFIPMGVGMVEWAVYYCADSITTLIPADVMACIPNFVIRLIHAGSSWLCIITTVLSGAVTFVSLCFGYSSSMTWATGTKDATELTGLLKEVKAGFDSLRSKVSPPTLVPVPVPRFIAPVYPKQTETNKGQISPGDAKFSAIINQIMASASSPPA